MRERTAREEGSVARRDCDGAKKDGPFTSTRRIRGQGSLASPAHLRIPTPETTRYAPPPTPPQSPLTYPYMCHPALSEACSHQLAVCVPRGVKESGPQAPCPGRRTHAARPMNAPSVPRGGRHGNSQGRFRPERGTPSSPETALGQALAMAATHGTDAAMTMIAAAGAACSISPGGGANGSLRRSSMADDSMPTHMPTDQGRRSTASSTAAAVV
jgi:hypothetical protein